ncbi:MAG: transcriptional repressor [Pyrinomonadaceae bacterium]|nr:transcriptional repressor [Pyrinomonadaceae bacterium]
MSTKTKKRPLLTRQRKQVLKVITESGEHLTANEIFDHARIQLPGISFATVYNSLNFLKREGFINEVAIGSGPCRFDPTTERHDHAVCEKCGRLVDLHLDIPNSLLSQAIEHSGFNSGSVEITFKGKCSGCQGK